MAASFYWHDYETWGANPALDRPCQFAGLRTDTDLNEVGAPLVIYSRPADDLLPHPDACLITGLAPQRCAEQGLPESDFASTIQRELAVHGTCGVGFNSLRFDDEVTRFLFYRNLLDPYAHAWQNGNSRWDLIDCLRLAHALRPDGMHWPARATAVTDADVGVVDAAVTSFRLEDLTAANDIPHSGAHDALADVRATLALARRLRAAQPRLFAYALTLRDQHRVRAMIDQATVRAEPLLHVSQRYTAAQGCLAPVATVAPHPTNPKGVLCFDLRQDPALLLDLSVDDLRQRLFTRAQDLPAGVTRIGIKGIKVNAAPMLAPMSTLTAEAAARWAIDPAQARRHARQLATAGPALAARLKAVYQDPAARNEPTDPDLMLYAGGFFSDGDRRAMAALRALAPAELGDDTTRFDDPRLPTMVFRWRARNWPETLSEAEREDWDAWRLERLTDDSGGDDGPLTVDACAQRIAELRATRGADPAVSAILDGLDAWIERVMDAGV